MTETTAKKGMTRYKKGHSKNEFDYDFLQSINYDDKRLLKEVIETLFNVNKSLGEKINEMKIDREVFMIQYKTLNEEHDRMLIKVNELSAFTLD